MPRRTDSGCGRPDNGLAVPGLQWAKGDLNPHPLAGTWPSTMRVCLFRHSPLFTPSTSEKPLFLVALSLLLLLRSLPTLRITYPATGSNSVEICFGSNFRSVAPVAYSVPPSRGRPPSTSYFAVMKRGPPAHLSYDAIWRSADCSASCTTLPRTSSLRRTRCGSRGCSTATGLARSSAKDDWWPVVAAGSPDAGDVRASGMRD